MGQIEFQFAVVEREIDGEQADDLLVRGVGVMASSAVGRADLWDFVSENV